MMTFILLLAGLILLLVGSSWFTGAATVGGIFLGFGVLFLLLQIGTLIAVLKKL